MKSALTVPARGCIATALLLVCVSVLAQSSGGPTRVVYHLDDARTGRFALHIAEDQLASHPDMKITMVAYGAGINFLLEGATDKKGEPYEPAVRDLQSKGVEFKVCSTTLSIRDIPRDQVLDGMQFVPGGTYEVIRLQAEEGYVYLKP